MQSQQNVKILGFRGKMSKMRKAGRHWPEGGVKKVMASTEGSTRLLLPDDPLVLFLLRFSVHQGKILDTAQFCLEGMGSDVGGYVGLWSLVQVCVSDHTVSHYAIMIWVH